MTIVIAALIISTLFAMMPLVGGWANRRPLTALDRHLSEIDASIDARRVGGLRSWSTR